MITAGWITPIPPEWRMFMMVLVAATMIFITYAIYDIFWRLR